ncbi:hypothetical protein [[Mycobacterium] fortunisiensis]
MSVLRTVFDRQVSIRQLFYLAVTAGVIVGLPYLIVGVIWASMHADHLRTLSGADQLFSILGEVVAWPVLLIADVSLV